MCFQPSKRCMRFAVALITILFVASSSSHAAGENSGIFAPPGLPSVSERSLSGYREVSSVRDGRKHITLEQAKQQASRAISPASRLAQFSVEAARQHRLAVQSDYFPKISGTFTNFHFNKFMGQTFVIGRPLLATILPSSIPLVGKDSTMAAVTVVQPITPLLKIRQAVDLARADERIARAKAGMSVSAASGEVEKSYFELLIAQWRETLAKTHARKAANAQLVASTTPIALDVEKYHVETVEANEELIEASIKLKELTNSFDDLLGWPTGTELELDFPAPLVENITFQEVSDRAVATNPDVIEAEQNLIKARAATKLAKLDYIPDVVAIWGYTFNNNVIPALPLDFSYVGVMASYNVFDFGKRERTIKERNAQVGMAEAALELVKAKAAASVKQTYFELVRARQVSEMTQQADSVVRNIALKYAADDPEVEASRAKLEIEMLQADLEHRQIYAKLSSLLGNTSDGR